MIFTENYEIDRFFDVNSTSTHIGTGQDLVNLIEQKCGTEIAEFVSTLIKDSSSLITLDEENAELRCQLIDLQDEYDSLEMQYDELYEKSNEVCKELEELKKPHGYIQVYRHTYSPYDLAYKCSMCGRDVDRYETKCPNCGAILDEDGD